MLDKELEFLDPSIAVCHSGGAEGSDTVWSDNCDLFNIKVRAYSYKTNYHTSKNKVEISEDEFKEGVIKIKLANKTLARWGIDKYINLLARNWIQIKNSNHVIAIGELVEKNTKNRKGILSKAKNTSVSGGTGWAVQMAIDKGISVHVFDQYKKKWFRYSYSISNFIEIFDIPIIESNNFTGIGTRKIEAAGEEAIKTVLKRTFKK